MTETTTPRDIRSDQMRGSGMPDSPAVSTRARARIPVTQGDIKWVDRIGQAFTSWWLLTSEPMTLKALWTASGVDRKRIPQDSPALRLLWQVSNWTDRLIMFGLLAVTPTALTGPLRWCAVRPTRRIGLYLTAAALTGVYLYGRKY